MALSAARALLFNAVLAQREGLGFWNRAMPGDLVNLDGSNSFFGPITDPAELDERMRALEVHPTGPLLGVDTGAVTGEALALEQSLLAELPNVLAVAAKFQAKPSRRPLRARARTLQWRWIDGSSLCLEFTLSRGVYATALLRALGVFSRPDRRQFDTC
jgi:tRNA pseudouridine13 synthase